MQTRVTGIHHLWRLALASSFRLLSAGCEDAPQDPRAPHFTSHNGSALADQRLLTVSTEMPWCPVPSPRLLGSPSPCPPPTSGLCTTQSSAPLSLGFRLHDGISSPLHSVSNLLNVSCVPCPKQKGRPVYSVPENVLCYTGLHTSGESARQYSAVFISWVLPSDSKKNHFIRGVLSQNSSIPPPTHPQLSK